MTQQLAGVGHSHASQLGWGASLKSHWEPEIPVNGFDQENDHPFFCSVEEAIKDASFDAYVLTEMVEIKAAIRYESSAEYLSKFAVQIHSANPQARIYLYETWHRIDDPLGWLERLDRDLSAYWENRILNPALIKLNCKPVIYVIPVGSAFSSFFKALAEQEEITDIKQISDIFLKQPDGQQDTIHLNDLGNYFSALVHYSVLYQKSPIGLPRQLFKVDGSEYQAPSEAAAKLMQEVIWRVVCSYRRTGLEQNEA